MPNVVLFNYLLSKDKQDFLSNYTHNNSGSKLSCKVIIKMYNLMNRKK